jgi:hypothetical protein
VQDRPPAAKAGTIRAEEHDDVVHPGHQPPVQHHVGREVRQFELRRRAVEQDAMSRHDTELLG